MARVALLVEYLGKNFHGCQYQLGLRTVQSDLESALSTYLRKPTKVIFSGRTDSGVHASGQIAHTDIQVEDSDIWRLLWALNGILKNDLSIRNAQIVPDTFHARFEATKRQYVYRLLNRPQRSAILKNNHYFIPRPLDIHSMQMAAQNLLGRHDFSSFRSSNADKTNTICEVSRAEMLNKGEGQVEFWIAADHFVYNMVRIIVGTLVDIGLGKKTPNSLVVALAGNDRGLAGMTAPAWGLTLESVTYPEKYKLFQAL